MILDLFFTFHPLDFIHSVTHPLLIPLHVVHTSILSHDKSPDKSPNHSLPPHHMLQPQFLLFAHYRLPAYDGAILRLLLFPPFSSPPHVDKPLLVMFLRLQFSFSTCLLILSHHMTCSNPFLSHDLVTWLLTYHFPLYDSLGYTCDL